MLAPSAMASRLRCLLPVAGLRRVSSGSGGGGATLSALIERLPVVTPELTEWEVEWREARREDAGHGSAAGALL